MSGTLFNADGSPVSGASVNFKIEIYDKAGTCLLYSENHLAQDLSHTKGGFSLLVSQGTGIVNSIDSSSPNAMTSKVFENVGAIAGGWAGCTSGATLANGDERLIRVYYDVGSGLTAMNPDVPIASSAYAIVAETLQGLRPADLIQVHDDVANKLTQANVENVFSATNYPKLTDLLSGTSASYISSNPTSAVSFNNQLLTNVASPVAATDATNKDYVDSNIGGQTADLSGIGPATGDGYTLIWDKTAGKWTTGVPSATDNTKLPLAGGTMTGTIDFAAAIGTGINLNGNDLIGTGYITMSPLKTLTLGSFTSAQETTLIGTLTAANAGASWYNTTSNTFKIWNGTTAISQTFTGATAGGDLTGTYPNPTIANDKIVSNMIDSAGVARNRLVISDQTTGANLQFATCNTNEVLRYEDVNGWVCRDPSAIVTFPVTSVNGKDGGAVVLDANDLGLGTAALENVGTNPGDVPQLDGGGKIPAALLPTGTGTITEVAAGTGLSGGGTTGTVTLNLADTVVTPSAYGTAGKVATFTVDQQGRLTAAGQTDISIGDANITGVDGSKVSGDIAGNAAGFTGNLAGDVTGPQGTTVVGKIQGRTIAATTPNPNEVLMWNDTDSQWEPSPVPSAPVTSVAGRTGAVTLDYGDINNAAGKYLTYKPNNVACGNDELLKFDGTNWVCTSVASALNGDYALSGANTDITSLGATTAITSTAALTLSSSTNGNITLQPNGTGLVTTSSALRVTPTTLPAAPAAGTIAMDSSTGNAMKYYDGTAWQTLGTGSGSGDFMKNGSVAMTGDFDGGTHNITNIGSVSGSNVSITSTGANNGITLTPNGTGLVTSSSALLITPTALPAAPAAGTVALDSGASNVLKYYNGSAWQTVNTSNAIGDFMKDGSVAMTGDFDGGTHNITNIGSVSGSSLSLSSTGANNGITLTPNGTGIVTSSSALRVTPTTLPAGPAAGTIAMDSSTGNAMKYYDGTAWQTLGTGSGSGDFMKNGSVAMTGDFDGGTHNITNIGSVSGSNVSITSTGTNNGITLTPNGTGLVTTSSPINVTPSALPAAPVAGTIAFDSGASNVLKYYNGSAWQTVNTSNATGDFMKDGSVAMTGDFNAGTHNLTNIGTNVTGAAALTLASGGTSDLTLTSASGVLSSTTPLKITPTTLPGSPAAGTIAMDSSTGNAMKYYDGTAWQTLGTGTGTGDFMKNGSVAMTGNLKLGANYISNDGGASEGLAFDTSGNANFTANVGIGTSAPDDALSVVRNQDALESISLENNNHGVSAGAGLNLYGAGADLMLSAFNNSAGGAFGSLNKQSYAFVRSGAAANGMSVGTSNTNPLLLSTNDTERLRIDGSGKVGIGTTNPTTALEVNGTVKATAFQGDGSALTGISASPAGSNTQIQFNNSGAMGASSNLVWDNTNGRVGIGTTTPDRTLTVDGDTGIWGALYAGYTNSGAGSYTQGLTIFNDAPVAADNGTEIIFSGDGALVPIGEIGAAFTTAANANSYMKFSTRTSGSVSEKMRITANGNVGIGTTTPERLLQVNGAARFNPTTTPGSAAAGDLFFDSASSNALKFYDGTTWQTVGTGTGSGDFKKDGSVAMTGNLQLGANYISNDGGANEGLAFDTSGNANFTGNVGIGTASPEATLEVNPGNLLLTRTDNDAFGAKIVQRKSRGAIVQSGDELGYMRFDGYDGAAYKPAANIGVIVDGTPGTDDMPGAMIFSTTPDGASALSERMRITNTGNVGIGTTTPDTKLHIVGTTGATLKIADGNQGAGKVLTSDANGVASWAQPTTGLSNFTEAISTTSPNDIISVASLTANNAATHVAIALVPKGSGGLMAQVPDGTTTGGNKRGIYAVDWQHTRTANTMVASGQYSVIGGGMKNTASGDNSTVSGGANHIASGSVSTIGGGTINTASNTYATVSGGVSNTASGVSSTVNGGDTNTASGQGSTANGGFGNKAIGQYSLASNLHTTADSFAQSTFGQYNQLKGSENASSWVATDPLFVVGNGTGAGSPSNALMILKNGNVGIGTTGPVDLLSLSAVNASATHASLNVSNTALVGASASGTYIGANPASASADFINYQVGGTTKFSVDKNGKITGDGSGLTGISAGPAGSNTQIQFNNSGVMGASSNLVWDNTNGSLGIGTSNPTYSSANNVLDIFMTNKSGFLRLENTDSSTARWPAMVVANHMGTANAGFPILSLQNNRGNLNSPTALQTNDALGEIEFAGHDGTGSAKTGANIIAYATQPWLGSARGTQLMFQTTPNDTTTYQPRMLIDQNGNVGIGTTTPGAKLEVSSGTANTSGLKFTNFTSSAPTSTGQAVGVDASGNLVTIAAAAGGLTNFTEALSTAAPNATIPVASLMAQNAATNVDIALAPKGTGALTARIADGTVTGGNKRGTKAVDWQMETYSVSSEVASGTYSTIGGGHGNTASGIAGTVAGGERNIAGADESSVGGGYYNRIYATNSTISGGYGNSILSGTYSTISGGYGNNTGGQYAAVPGGYTNTASGQYSMAANKNTTAESYAQTTLGHYNLPKGSENASSWITTDPLFVIGNGTGAGASRATALMVLKNGNVGIGTTSPGSILDVNGAITTRGIASPSVSSTGQGVIYFDSTDNKFKVSQNGGAYTDLVAAGGAGDFMKDGSVAMTGNLKLGANYISNDGGVSEGLAFDTSGNANFTGNLGIGTTSPSANLHVSSSSATAVVQVETTGPNNAYFQAKNSNKTYITGVAGTNWILYEGGLNIVNASTSQFSIFAGGPERFRVSGTGNIGIGTTSPVDLLSLGAVNASTTRASLNLSNTALSGASASGTYIGANPASASADFINYQVGGTTKFSVDKNGKVTGDGSGLTGISAGPAGLDTQIQFNNAGAMGASSNLVWDNTNARLGIGTTSPTQALEVTGISKLSTIYAGDGSAASPAITFGSDSTLGFYKSGSYQLGISVLGTQRWKFTQSELDSVNGGSGPRVYWNSTTESTPAFTFVGNSDTGMYNPATNSLGFSTAGTERVRIDSNGNVGIGTNITGPSNARLIVASPIASGGGRLEVSDDNIVAGRRAIQISSPGTGYNYAGINAYNYNTSTTDNLNIQWSGGKTGFGSPNAPGSPLSVKGGVSIGSTFYGLLAPNDGMIVEGNVGIGTTVPGSILDVNGAITARGIASPSVSSTGQGVIYFDSTDNKFKVSQNGGAYTDLVSGGGGGALTNFTESVNTAAPNATVPVVSLLATNAATDVDVVLSPKGSGALTAQVADGTTTGGNKRGPYAVDWQRSRISATQAASGDHSTIGGGSGNTASATNSSVIGGAYNTASGWGSSVLGGNGNTANGERSVAAGDYTTADSYAQATFGRFNQPKGGETASSWVTTDPLFVVGNGTSSGAKSTALMILKNGKVGIGTSSPTANLEVSGYATIGGIDIVSTGLTQGSWGSDFTLQVTSAGGTPSYLKMLAANGNVGIGTTTPAANAKLDVNGQIKSGFLSHASLNTDWTAGNIQVTSAAAGTLTFTSGSMYDGASYVLILTSAGTFTMSTTGDITSWKCLPACSSNQITATNHTVLTIIKAGTTGYLSWGAGYQ